MLTYTGDTGMFYSWSMVSKHIHPFPLFEWNWMAVQ